MNKNKQIEVLRKYIEALECLVNDHYETGLKDDLIKAEQQLKILNIPVVVGQSELLICDGCDKKFKKEDGIIWCGECYDVNTN